MTGCAGKEVHLVSSISSPEASGCGSLPLTLAVCSNRLENVRNNWRNYVDVLQKSDCLLIVLDVEDSEEATTLGAEMRRKGVRVIVNGRNLGLSASRNIILEACYTNFLVFIDDDVSVPKQTIDKIRIELTKGTEIVGVLIKRPEKWLELPWYISEGQYHYLAIHNPRSRTFNTWGACMGLSRIFAEASNLKFRSELGRKGRGLQSGDDTTFLREMKAKGAKETFILEACVFHNINGERLSLKYMIRRAYWQGRSEFRRGDAVNGMRKEWARFFSTDTPVILRAGLALLYMVPVIVGVLRELLILPGAGRLTRQRQHALPTVGRTDG